jgi:hypothetical protein
MNLWFESFDGRGRRKRPIIDKDTGNEVGSIMSLGVGSARNGGIHVSLFDGKYKGRLHTSDQCWGFVRGVETVLNHMTAIEA